MAAVLRVGASRGSLERVGLVKLLGGDLSPLGYVVDIAVNTHLFLSMVQSRSVSAGASHGQGVKVHYLGR